MKNVVVQGLGFVGLAMSVAVASARDSKKYTIQCYWFRSA